MFETPQVKEHGDAPTAEAVIVSGHADGGVVIRQRGAKDDQGLVIPPEQAESLIAAIRRHLNPK